MIKVKITNKRAGKAYRKAATELRRNILKATELAGRYIKAKVQEVFMAQGPGWAPLNPEYVKWKARSGFDTRILFRHYRLFQAINFERLSFDSGHVGIADGKYTGIAREVSPWRRGEFKRLSKSVMRLREERMTFVDVARIHEYGGGRTPPRPFFKPVFENEKEKIVQFYMDAVTEALAPYRPL